MAKHRYISPGAIEHIAQELRDRAGLRAYEHGYSVDVESMANVFRSEVRYVQFSPGDVSARIRRHPDGGSDWEFLIEVNASDSVARRRYSIAHEVSHALLHADDGADFDFTEYRRPLTDYSEPREMYKEVQANMLAAALLMPQASVTECWRQVDDIDDLARAFNVSRDSAYWRLNNLNLLADD